MNIFKNYTFSWWQVGIFKLSVLAFGVSIGAYWNSFFSQHLTLWIVIAVVSGLYIGYISLNK